LEIKFYEDEQTSPLHLTKICPNFSRSVLVQQENKRGKFLDKFYRS